LIVKGISSRALAKYISKKDIKKGARPKDITALNNDIELYSNIISLMSSEILFYPMETVLHRIQLQGTRTIIDNLDSGCTVIPILTSYEGAVDCYVTTVTQEGFSGLYKGFGAMLLQFTAHIAVIKLSKWIITQIAELSSDKPPKKVQEFYNLEPANLSQQQPNSATISRSTSYVSSLQDELS
jgi:solute carrier family 25 protein 46